VRVRTFGRLITGEIIDGIEVKSKVWESLRLESNEALRKPR